MLKGDMLGPYTIAGRRVTNKAREFQEADPFRPYEYEANISRRLGFKSKSGEPTFIYWRHIPVARLEANGSCPHIYLSMFHVGGQAQHTRALFALNPLLDYLLTGVRLSPKGVEFERRHGDPIPWPKTFRKPALFMPVAGRRVGAHFWNVDSVEFVLNRQLALPGGADYQAVTPMSEYDAPAPADELAGLT